MDEHKTFVVPTMAENNDIPVNMREIVHFAKNDGTEIRTSDKNRYKILFFTKEVAKEGQSIEWSYKTKKCRDSEFSALIEIFSVPLIPNNN